MQVFLVGGAVRDMQLGRAIKDKDFVVVGSTPQHMLANNFIQVGSDFPVFLHPITKQEYALARTERKSGKGYKGFEVYADADVTLEEDLSRRDLTINAMAMEVRGLFDDMPLTGEVVDPFNGLDDIKHKRLRHVSKAFSEDPLRVLRVARFYGRFYDIGFQVAKSTLQLLIDLTESGELECLTKERVWTETSRALMQLSPQAYWQLLWDIGAMSSLYPSLAKAWQEDKCRNYIFSSLNISSELNLSLEQRWAIVMTSFADQENNTVKMPFSNTDDSLWTTSIQKISQNNKLPKKLTQFALLYAKYAKLLKSFDALSAEQMAELITACKAHKDSQTLQDLLTINHTLHLAKQYDQLAKVIHKFNSITIQDIDDKFQGAQIGEEINKLRIKAIASR